jgi:hypothetical protein
MRGEGGVAGSQPMCTAVHMEPNKLWRSYSLYNLWHKVNGRVGRDPLMPETIDHETIAQDYKCKKSLLGTLKLHIQKLAV